MLDHSKPKRSFASIGERKLTSIASRVGLIAAGALMCLLPMPVCAQQSDPTKPPVVVQPGAPGQPTRTLPPSSRATLPPLSRKDVEFMQGMIMHHAQAVEMTAMIESRTENKDLRLLGARISHSQSQEIKFMQRWLRGERTADDHADARNEYVRYGHARHGYVEPSASHAYARDAYRKADGCAE